MQILAELPTRFMTGAWGVLAIDEYPSALLLFPFQICTKTQFPPRIPISRILEKTLEAVNKTTVFFLF